jgi:hypothetical protein
VPGRDIDNVDAAARLEGLTDEQRDELSDRIHMEKRADRRDISFQEMRRMAREIKLESEGRWEEIEPTGEERERTQTRGAKHAKEDDVSKEKGAEGKAELEEGRGRKGKPRKRRRGRSDEKGS